MLTDEELEILDLLAEVTVAFFSLPEQRRYDLHDWTIQMHVLQQQVMSRSAIREYPNTFTPLVPEDGE